MESYKINNLTFSYPSSEKNALSDISLVVKKGEFITICGHSGCGKSTLLRLLKPIIAPVGKCEGEILFEGSVLSEEDLRFQSSKIGFVMQSPDSQIVTDKVWHELAFGLESLGLKTEEIRVRVAEMASFFGIENWFHKKTTELSGGEKQLLNLASVMVMQPSVLILDEPTSQLDPIAAQEFLDAVAKLNRELGVTVIISEHRLEEVLAFTDRLVVMEKGSIIYSGKPSYAVESLNGRNVIESMSVAMRVFAALGGVGESPVTVREGREYLSKMAEEKNPCALSRKEKEANGKTIVEMKNACFRYDKDSHDVIKSLNIRVHRGELYAILGGNGSGKTTALSLLNGINKPYRGKVIVDDEANLTAWLPQNPQTVFTEKTVEKDLLEMASSKELFYEVINLCEIEELLKRHPYDLSGGEMQRAALAKLLLRSPSLLLLDEPTKGMDSHFKNKFASILKSLCKNGVTIIMVSHDVEFCAKYADRCAMFFDGGIVSENTPELFFAEKNFYTTAANRMARGIVDGAVTANDIICSFGGEEEENIQIAKKSETSKKIEEEAVKKQKVSIPKIVTGIVLFIIGILLMIKLSGKFSDWRMYATDIGILLSFAASFTLVVPGKKESFKVQYSKGKTWVSAFGVFMALVIMPATALAGIYLLDDKKYYFISLMLIIEAMIPFALSFEKRKPTARELVVIAVLCAIGVGGRIAFFAFPQFKPIAAVIIVSGICLGAEAGFITGAVSAFISNFYFSQGPWTPWQMLAFAAIGFLAGVLFKNRFLRKTRMSLCVFGLLSVAFIYGPLADLSALSYVSEPTIEYILSTWMLGLPFNLLHGASAAFFLYTCGPAVIEKLERVKIKYGILR